jgi:phosphopantothenoylcysteine decarboxylase / phosphopantothenate---cysteine ligase
VGRMLEAYELADSVRAFFEPRLLQGKRVLVTAGPTYEAIDAVRGITNLSSGKMGYAVARAAREAGAEVILVSGPVCLQPPSALKLVRVTSAEDMFSVVKNELPQAHIFVSVAAVADYRAKSVSGQKIKKTVSNMTLELTPNPDILEYAAGLAHAPFCVGFAAETENLLENAEAKRRKKKLPLLAANFAQDSIGSEECELTLLDDSGRHLLTKAPKLVQARRLVKHIALLHEKNT